MNKARTYAAILAAAAMPLLPVVAHADPSQYSAGEHVDAGLSLDLGPHGVVGTYTYGITAQTSPHATAYCIDLTTQYRKGAALREAPWADAPVIAPYAAQVSWLLHHSYPYLPVDAVQGTEPFDNGLSVVEAVTATQAAIWHYSNGVVLSAANVIGDAGQRHDVMALYDHLTGSANAGMTEVPDTTLSLTNGSTGATGGVAGEHIGPLSLTTTASATLTLTAPDGVRIVDAAGNPVGESSPTAELYLDVPAGTAAGSATITASVAGEIPTGRLFTPARTDAESATQSLVLATVEPSTATASVTVPWTAAPELATTATDAADGDKHVLPAGSVTDVVVYRGLVVGRSYTLVGELVDPATGAPTGATGTTTFTPTEPDGEVAVTIPIGAGAAATTLVVFERAYDASGKLVAKHADLSSPSQTITVDSPVPPPAVPQVPSSDNPPGDQPPAVPQASPGGQPPAETPAIVPAHAADQEKTLADTGADATHGLLIAGAFLMLGLGGTVLGRRKKAPSPATYGPGTDPRRW